VLGWTHVYTSDAYEPQPERKNRIGNHGPSCNYDAENGPTQLEKGGPFNETDQLRYTAQDIRFTSKDNILYATVLGWPGEKILIKSLAGGPDPNKNFWNGLYPSEIVSIHMLGDGKELKWEMTMEGLTVETTKTKPCEHAFVFKIVRKKPF
jgi:alpha-L-fucosidase